MIIPVLIFIASAAFGAPVALSETTSYAAATNPDTLHEYVREYFKDTPVLADIAWCESRMRHYGKDGKILRGEVDSDDIGVMQINTRFHKKDAEELGIDLYTLSGNLKYAKYLYKKQGSKPWFKSAPCWGKVAKSK